MNNFKWNSVPHVTGLVFIILFSQLFFNFVYASVCANSVVIEADEKKIKDGFIYFEGNVKLTSASLTLETTKLSVNNNSRVFYHMHMGATKFVLVRDKKIIYGNSDNTLFNAVECILDLIGNAHIITENSNKEYNHVKYFLNEDRIEPLLNYFDQGIQLYDKKTTR